MLSKQITKYPHLVKAAQEFQHQCRKFIQRHPKFTLIKPSDFDEAVSAARSEADIKRAAEVFGDQIKTVSQFIEAQTESSNESWVGKLRNFMTGLYPLVKLG